MTPSQATHDLGRMIITVRETKVILDSDLALLYGVSTMAFNQAIKRNRERFPELFMFRLERQEFTHLISQIVISKGRGGRRKLPYVFTEHGALMAANVLRSPKAVKMSVALIEAFVRLRQEFASTVVLARRLAEIEKTVMTHDRALVKLFRGHQAAALTPARPAAQEDWFSSMSRPRFAQP